MMIRYIFFNLNVEEGGLISHSVEACCPKDQWPTHWYEGLPHMCLRTRPWRNDEHGKYHLPNLCNTKGIFCWVLLIMIKITAEIPLILYYIISMLNEGGLNELLLIFLIDRVIICLTDMTLYKNTTSKMLSFQDFHCDINTNSALQYFTNEDTNISTLFFSSEIMGGYFKVLHPISSENIVYPFKVLVSHANSNEAKPTHLKFSIFLQKHVLLLSMSLTANIFL